MKNRIYRWLCLLTAAAMIAFSAPAVLAEEQPAADAAPAAQQRQPYSDKQYEVVFGLMTRLGILDSGLSAEDIDQNAAVSRGEFADYTARLLNLSGGKAQKVYYTDVPTTHFAYEAINMLTAEGYFNGTGGNRFEPDEPILVRDAQTTLLKTLGLAPFISSGYADEAFIRRAVNDANLNVAASTETNLTFYEMIMMMYNALQADYYYLGAISDGMSHYYQKEGDSLLYATRNMRYEANKLMTAAGGVDIYGGPIAKNVVVIDGKTYDAGSRDFAEFLGKYVEFIYEEGASNTIVWASEYSLGRTLTLVLDENSRYEAQKGILTYYEDASERSARIGSNAAVIYNGRISDISLEEALNKPRTLVTLSASGNSALYDIVLIESYYNIVVGNIDNTSMTYYDKTSDTGVSLNENDYEVLRIENTEGGEIPRTDIQKNNVLSVFESEDGTYVKVIVSAATAQGNVENVSSDNYVTIGGAVYKLYSESLRSSLMPGSVVICYLDFLGYIAAVTTNSGSEGKFVAVAIAADGGSDSLGSYLYMKLLREDGTQADYDAAPRLVIDDVVYTNLSEAYNVMCENGIFKPQIMLCTLNGSGKLSRIDLAKPDDGAPHPLIKTREIEKDLASFDQAMYVAAQQKIGTKMLTNSDTKVFFIPANFGTDYERCKVGPLREWEDYRGAVSYRTTQDDPFYEQYIVNTQISYGSTAQNHELRMFDEFREGIDEDGNPVKFLVCSSGTSFTEWEVDKYADLDQYNLKRGDAIRIGVTTANNNKVEFVTIADRAGSDAVVNKDLRLNPYQTRTISCYANDKLGYALKVGWDNGADFDEMFNLSASTPIIVYDSEKDKVYSGTMDDILTYRSGGESSKLLVQTYQGAMSRVLVYR